MSEPSPSWGAFHCFGTLVDWRSGILGATAPRFGVPVSVTITLEDVGSYRPAAGHINAFHEEVQYSGGHWVHVACSWLHDVEPCLHHRVPAVFVNRELEDFDSAGANATIHTLEGLPDIVDNARRRQQTSQRWSHPNER